MANVDYELEYLLGFDGYEYRFASSYRIKIEAARVAMNPGRPHGIKYSLTLHDSTGKRLYGMDNAHKAGRKREFDHRHVHGARRVVAYVYRGPVELLADFYREVERILEERGVSWR